MYLALALMTCVALSSSDMLVEASGGVRWKWERYPVFRPDPTMPTMPDTIHVKLATNPFDGFSGK